MDKALAEHKPMWAFMAHWETGSGRINDLKGFSDAYIKHGVMGIVDAASSLGVAEFNIDDYPGVVAWASCPQKGVLSLPLTYAPVSFADKAIGVVKKRGCYTYVHHPILEARHWGIVDGRDVSTPIYHRTHSCYAVAAFHEALRIILGYGRHRKASDYAYHENALRQAVEGMGCDVISNTTSLIVLNLPRKLSGKEKDLVAGSERRALASGRPSPSRFRCESAFLISCRRSRSSKLEPLRRRHARHGRRVRQGEGDERAQSSLHESRLGAANGPTAFADLSVRKQRKRGALNGVGPLRGAFGEAVWPGRIVTLGRSCSRTGGKSTSDHVQRVSCPSERLNGQ